MRPDIEAITERAVQDRAFYEAYSVEELPHSLLDREALLAHIDALTAALRELRSRIHACNRNPIPNSKRVEWRDFIDNLLGDGNG